MFKKISWKLSDGDYTECCNCTEWHSPELSLETMSCKKTERLAFAKIYRGKKCARTYLSQSEESTADVGGWQEQSWGGGEEAKSQSLSLSELRNLYFILRLMDFQKLAVLEDWGHTYSPLRRWTSFFFRDTVFSIFYKNNIKVLQTSLAALPF